MLFQGPGPWSVPFVGVAVGIGVAVGTGAAVGVLLPPPKNIKTKYKQIMSNLQEIWDSEMILHY